MPSLSELQGSFKRHLFHGDSDIVELIIGTENASDEQRLATYRNAYYGRLVEALSVDFTAVKTLLGDDEFSRLCHDYINTYPSTHYSLRWFGRQFPNFIQQHSVNQKHACLAELATLEWTFINAFDAADENTLDASIVTEIPVASWPNISIHLHPSVFYFNYHWNIVDIWYAVREQDTIPLPAPLNGTSTCMIWRQELTTRYRILDDDEATMLHAAAQGANFAQLCELLAENKESDFNQVAMRAASLLKTWLEADMIVQMTSQKG